MAKAPPVDCFYVYPTASRDQGKGGQIERGCAAIQKPAREEQLVAKLRDPGGHGGEVREPAALEHVGQRPVTEDRVLD